MTTRRSTRTQAPLYLDHLQRLADLADVQHTEFTRPAAAGGNSYPWAKRRIAVVLAQGAARHYLHPDAGHGVKDLDVWTFYASIPGQPLRSGRYETHADFGPSELGRNTYPTPPARQQKTWNTYTGRRIDFLVRELTVRPRAPLHEVRTALRGWLQAGAAQPCRHLHGGTNSSAHWLAHKAMVWLGTPINRDHAGEAVWDVLEDAPQLLRSRRTG